MVYLIEKNRRFFLQYIYIYIYTNYVDMRVSITFTTKISKGNIMRKITTILLTCGVVCAVVAIAVPLAILASEGAYTKITLAVLDKDSADRYITNGGMEDPNADPLPTPTFNSGSK
ncbi:hypothetical protein FACS1894218_2930 [Bacilli bacterium]|nr:hypothetical protein FACS1894218_2930 [Bacilli bacterium]